VNPDVLRTAPVIMSDKTYVVFESVVLGPGERGEIVLVPDRPMRDPCVFMSERECEGVVVEEVVMGQTVVAKDGRWPVEVFRNGHKLDGVVTSESPLKVVVANEGSSRTSVGASLVDSKEKL
jgi:hypothetical protein